MSTRKPRTLLAAALLALAPSTAALAAATPASAASAPSGAFTLLNYNVAGLPVVHEPPTTLSMEDAASRIGQGLPPYDVVNEQEDFNYHAYIYAGDTHPYRTATSGPAGIGDGLNTLSNYAFDDFQRTKWSSCYPDNGDCFTPKGFSFSRLRLAEGVYLDYYNLHTNAGTSSGDETARENEWQQLTAFIQANSAGNAVVIAGDTNSRYTRGDDQLPGFVAANGLTDAWVQLEQGGVAPAAGATPLMCDEAAITDTCEITNKTFYRSNQLVTLNATGYHNEHAKFLDSNGLMLSDMDPILTDFSWAQSPDYRQSDTFGGPHGSFYTDLPSIPAQARATTLTLRSGTRVDAVGLTLDDGTTLTHGGTGGSPASLTLGAGEYLTQARLCEGQYNGDTRIFYAEFTTNLGRSLAGGTQTSDCVTDTAPAGWQLAGFYGRQGAELDKLGVVYTQR
ncbi:jacalin-like lectin [Kitasatospora viridis]|uniref:Jacalin-like lectin domain-containing protein n=1 Tax=Kitasatospora viridis TaxID=281105 RepID=A0A561TVR4_9ACTN|nr:jacalin-like lectin [Kitasatospora viridis]TWF91203.1 jacalin-like lectin domain-containing protein [Kitasatospora viridis]